MVSSSNRKIPFILSGLAAFLTLRVAGYSLLNLSVYRPLLGLGPLLFVVPFLSSLTVEATESHEVYAV